MVLRASSDCLGSTEAVVEEGDVAGKALCSSWDVNSMDSSSREPVREGSRNKKRKWESAGLDGEHWSQVKRLATHARGSW